MVPFNLQIFYTMLELLCNKKAVTMKIRKILYIFLMIIFIVLAYFLLDRGLNAKTKIYVNYADESMITYKVYLKDNDKYLEMDNKYDSSLVNNIIFDFDFKTIFSERVNGYYKYNLEGILVAYTNNINDSLLRKKYILISDVVDTLNTNGNSININSSINIDYSKYRYELKKISHEYGFDVNGYLELQFNVFENLNFKDMDNIKEDSRNLNVIIPLSYDNFKINVNTNNKSGSYYDFSNNQSVNYLLMVFGAFCLALGISYLGLVIRNMYLSYRTENEYKNKLRKIISENKDVIIRVKRFYNKKKYNLIYVYNFNDLVSMSKKKKLPISYREVRRNTKTIFLLVEDDNAWIYQLIREN